MDSDLTQVSLLTAILTSPSDLALLGLLTLSAFSFKHFIHPMSAWTIDPALLTIVTIPCSLLCSPLCDPKNGLESHAGLALD
jgi:hypothetical protein